jgi:hypothetical protein
MWTSSVSGFCHMTLRSFQRARSVRGRQFTVIVLGVYRCQGPSVRYDHLISSSLPRLPGCIRDRLRVWQSQTATPRPCAAARDNKTAVGASPDPRPLEQFDG